MKSSDPPAWLSTAAATALAVVAALAIGQLRPRLAERHRAVAVGRDVYALPSPEQTVAASLGWRSALADALYAHVLVSYGLHFEQKRRFEFVGNYLDTINALDPTFRAPYRFADTLLTLGPIAPRPKDFVKAREILERGMAARPNDAELWNSAGQFLAYLAPNQLKDPAVMQQWRLEGARRMARACELMGASENLPYHCITAAGIFTQAGEREATIQFLERVLAVTDNPEIRQLALSYLQKKIGERERDRVSWRVERFDGEWARDLPFASKDLLLIVGPPVDVARCAGTGGSDRACPATWRAWGERLEQR